MTDLPAAFLKEPDARQLGALAANLARIASSARKPARTRTIDPMLDECIRFIEHTAPKLSPEIATELVDLQVMLGLWRRSWPLAQKDIAQRTLLYLQARKWSDQIVDYSGLLK